MALPLSSGICFFPEDDVPPPGDPIYDLRPGQPPFVGGVGVNTVPTGSSRQWAAQTHVDYPPPVSLVRQQVFLPLVQVSHQCQILTTTARTTLTQIFYHPGNRPISKATYTFPLYANCSVVSFVCRVGERKVITGVVKPKQVAKQTYESATRSGQMAGLLEYNTPDVFTTSIGNIPTGERVKVEIGYILELPHDAEVDGIRFTVPLSIAPRYGPPPPGAFGQNGPEVSMDNSLLMGFEITMGEAIKSVGSPSHPTVVQLGHHGKGKGRANDQPHDPKKALVTLSQSPAELLRDFVLLITTVTPHFISTPQALLETHPTIPGHQALKVTLVPRFEMPRIEAPRRTEIIFLVDRSGSMSNTIGYVKSALRVFLKSLPLGCFFNIISFGGLCTSLWERSRAYTEGTLNIASEHIETFDASYGGTELLPPLMQAFSRRRSERGMSTEIMVLTDGEIWRLPELLEYIQKMRKQSGGATRLFSLGVGERVSHALVQGIATAGGGYSQIVPSGETGSDGLANGLEAKVVRVLSSALTDHIGEYKLHVLHEEGDEVDSESEGGGEGVVPRKQITPAHPTPVRARAPLRRSRRISLFDPTAAPRQHSPAPPHSPVVNPVSALGSGRGSGNRSAHLKKLQGPVVIQAPFEIPPLFPYERSVVYLLVPPTTKQLKYARSVTLNATTIAGDKLSLSIPITRIERPGETVHQLAARMLLRDLEEGKSWLHSSKYGVPAGDSARVQEYVQREGEDLGMRWSLASKWTSFVGVEEEILNEAPIPAPAPPEGELSGLLEAKSSAPVMPSGLPETNADSENSMIIDTSTSSSKSDRTPLPRADPTHSIPMETGSKSLQRVVRGARVMNSGSDTMGRLLAPRDTPDPTHPVWDRHVLHSYQSPSLWYHRPALRQGYAGYSARHGPIPRRSRREEGVSGRASSSRSRSRSPSPHRGAFARSRSPDPPRMTLASQSSNLSRDIQLDEFCAAYWPTCPPARSYCSYPPDWNLPAHDSTASYYSTTAQHSHGYNGYCFKTPTSYNTNRRLVLEQAPAGPLINIHRLIAAQKFDGSFHIADQYVAELLGSLRDSAPKVCGGDKVAWVALLIAVILERKFAYLRDVWDLVVRKIWVFLSGREGVRVEEVKVVAEELVAGWK
ncbi:hypothetical protein C7212DRAFT_363851 [Tuber magnatum]|uniref:VIT-domain-containing protein n=1 Tax=Tuber magnatum TaxID=42249 RepID=A0A317SQQ7_9PEZI|nr:hypothetical protein C7212DRAFT_363851 [Tuber magnatum]